MTVSGHDTDARVLRVFFPGEQLVAFPAREAKKQIVLREILRRLPEAEDWTEPQINALLGAMYPPDYCTLRRALVDRGYVDRRAGVYRLTTAARAVREAGRGTAT